MGTKEYDYAITLSNNTLNTSNTYPYTGSSNLSDFTWYYSTCWCTCHQHYKTVYKYQITCPKCKTLNWMELDTIEKCTECGAKIKTVAEDSDYTVKVKQ